jgi:hypothetical protein
MGKVEGEGTGKLKVKLTPEHATKAQRGGVDVKLYSLTSALDGVGGQHHAPAALPLGKTQYLLYRKLGGPEGRYGRVRKISIPTGIRSQDRPAVASSYTD